MDEMRQKTITDQVYDAIEAAGKAGISRFAIARAADLDRAALSRFMAGTRGLDISSLDKLATVLSLSLTVGTPRIKPLRKGRPKKKGK